MVLFFLFLFLLLLNQSSIDYKVQGNKYLFDVIKKKCNASYKKDKFFFKNLFVRSAPLWFMTLYCVLDLEYVKKSNVKKLSLSKKNSCALILTSFLFANYLKAISLNTIEDHYNKSKVFFLVPQIAIDYYINNADELNLFKKFLNKEAIEVNDYEVFYRSENEELIFGAFMSDNFTFLNFVNNFDLNNPVCQKAALKKFITSDWISQDTYKDFFWHSIVLTAICKNKVNASKRFLILIYSAIFYVKKNNKFDFFKFENLLNSEFLNLSECYEIIFRELGEDLLRYAFFKDFALYFFVHYDEQKKENFDDKCFLSLIKKIIWNENSSCFNEIVPKLREKDQAKIKKINKYIEEIKQEKEACCEKLKKNFTLICKQQDFQALFNFFSVQDAIVNLENHMICSSNCQGNSQGCASFRVENKIKAGVSLTEKKFKTIVSFIDELALSLDKFICSDIQSMNAKNIFGVCEDRIVIQVKEGEYYLISYDAKKDQVVFCSREEISPQEIYKIESNDTKWY